MFPDIVWQSVFLIVSLKPLSKKMYLPGPLFTWKCQFLLAISMLVHCGSLLIYFFSKHFFWNWYFWSYAFPRLGIKMNIILYFFISLPLISVLTQMYISILYRFNSSSSFLVVKQMKTKNGVIAIKIFLKNLEIESEEKSFKFRFR